jgi:hypothetical protein
MINAKCGKSGILLHIAIKFFTILNTSGDNAIMTGPVEDVL